MSAVFISPCVFNLVCTKPQEPFTLDTNSETKPPTTKDKQKSKRKKKSTKLEKMCSNHQNIANGALWRKQRREVEEEVDDEEDVTTVTRYQDILPEWAKQSIIRNGLPPTVRSRKWELLYSVAQDGDCFETMLTRVSNHSKTLLVVETTNGSILGGFVECPWEERSNFFFNRGDQFRLSKKGTFYGVGHAFLFTIKTKSRTEYCTKTMETETETECDGVNVYKWTQKNPFIQMCDAYKGRLAMGGGGARGDFGFCIEDNFSRGSTCTCNTYDNEPLVSDEFFDVANFEVYGFSRFSF